MKLVHCDGRILTVRDAGPVIYELRAPGVPLKPCGWFLLEDDAARDQLRILRDSGLYERVI